MQPSTSDAALIESIDERELVTVFERFELYGGARANQFSIANFVKYAQFDGTEGSDTYVLTLSGLISGQSEVHVVDSGTGGTDSDTVQIWGGDGADTMHLDADTSRQQIVHDDPGAGFTLNYHGEETAWIDPAQVDAALIETRLEDLATIDDVEVTGSGTAGDPWQIRMLTADRTAEEQKFYRITTTYVDEVTTKVARATVTRIDADLVQALLDGQPDLDAIFERPANETQLFNRIEEQVGTFRLSYHGLVTDPLSTSSTNEQLSAALSALVPTDPNSTLDYEFEVTGEGSLKKPWLIKVIQAEQDERGNYFPIIVTDQTRTAGNAAITEVVSQPIDLADAAATVRPSVALGNPASYQRVYYDFTAETVEIHGGAGGDTFISDDSMAATRVYGDAGDDNFLIGRVLATKAVQVDSDGDSQPDTWIDVVAGFDGITPGVSYNGYFYGGAGDDYFEVNHNIGELQLFGESGDDTFFLKAMLQDTGQELNGGQITAGAGDSQGNIDEGDEDTLIDYVENNRVEIFGGSGFDTVVVAGTALGDQFYIFTDNQGTQYLYGAGLKLENIDGIERLALVTGAGDDTVYLYGLDAGLSLLINLGSGNDRLIVGGEEETFEVTYPAANAVYTVEHDLLEDVIQPINPGANPNAYQYDDKVYNDVVFEKRNMGIADKQKAFAELYKKWIKNKDVSISDAHWNLLENNLSLALKLFAQGIEKAVYAPVHGTSLWRSWSWWSGWGGYYAAVLDRQNYINQVNQFEQALLTTPNQEFGQSYYDGDYEVAFWSGGRHAILPSTIDFQTMANFAPRSGFYAGNRPLDEVFFYEYLRPILAYTVWGDFVHSDQVRMGTALNSPRLDNWGYEPDLYKGDLYSDQIVTGRRSGWFWSRTYYMPHITGEEGVWIPGEKYAAGRGAELFWDLLNLFYDVDAPHSINEINVTNYYTAEVVRGAASYRFDDLPERTVDKILPENYDLSRIAGVVRLGGGTGSDVIEINARDNDGLDAVVQTQTLELGEYEFDSGVSLTLESGITGEDVQSALIRANKESQIGVLNQLLDGSLSSATVEISKDDVLLAYSLRTPLEDLQTAVNALKNVPFSETERVAYRNDVEKFTLRGLQLLGDGVTSTANFSLDSLDALLNHHLLLAMVAENLAEAISVRDQLSELREFLTLVSVSNSLRAENYSWSGSGALTVYKQNSPNLDARTVKYEYSQDIWEPSELQDAENYNTLAGRYSGRLDSLREEDEIEPLASNDLNNELGTRSLRDIKYTIGNQEFSVAASHPNAVGNQIEMEKAYVADRDNFDHAYYTYSYYGVNGLGQRVLESVAIRRLNELDTGVLVDQRQELDDNTYLTAANWDDYVTAVLGAGNSFIGREFTDANVRDFIQTAFNQSVRSNVDSVVIDGLRIAHGSGNMDTIDLKSLQDDSGFYLPEKIEILREVNASVLVPAAYVSRITPATDYTVTYDSVLGLNPAGLWFGGFEQTDLNVNSDDAAERVDRVRVDSTYHMVELNLNTGGGDDVFDIGRQADATWNLNGIWSNIYVTGGAGFDTVNISNANDPSEGVSTVISNGGLRSSATISGNDTIRIFEKASTNVTVEAVNVTLGAGADTLDVQDTAKFPVALNIFTTGGADVVELAEINPATVLLLDTGAGYDRVTVHSMAGSAEIRTQEGTDTIDIETTAAPLTVRAGTEDDTINVTDGGVVAGIQGNLTIHGDAGADTLNVVNSAASGDFNSTLTRDLISGLAPATIAYWTTETLNVDLGVGTDDVTVRSTSAETTIVDQGGDSDFQIGNTDDQLNDLAGRLTLDARGGADVLTLNDQGDGTPNQGVLEATQITQLGMAAGIAYAGFSLLNVRLGSGSDNLFVDSTHSSATNLDLGPGNDVLNIQAIAGQTIVSAGTGRDILRVNYLQNGRQSFADGIDAELTLHGQQESDLYEIGLSGSGSSLIHVLDDENTSDQTVYSGEDFLNIYGTNQADFFLFRPYAISSIELDENREPLPGGGIERVNYDENLNGGVNVYGRDGDDTFVFDDTSAKITVFGDAGNDAFQVGQMFQSPRDATNPGNGLAPADQFPTIPTTQGFLSHGISFSATLFGGTGEDSFTVYHTEAEIFLFGEEDDDTFRIRAFVKVDPDDPKAPVTNVNGGQGADFIEYAVNAPINIEGGDGFDTMTVVGTEFGDDFVVTKSGVYGAGLPVRYGGIEKVTLDGMEGNDTFFIESTDEDVQVEIFGGRGSDTFDVAGGTDGPISVVAKDLEGHSGLVKHAVSQANGEYATIPDRDLRIVVADNDEAGVAVVGGSQTLLVDESGRLMVSYQIVLTMPPVEDVRVTAAPTRPRKAEEDAGGEGVLLNGNLDGVTLLFTQENWYEPQPVFVTAANDELAEGDRFVLIQHSVIQGGDPKDGGAYDGLAVPTVVAKVLDNDAATVSIEQTQGETMVSEDAAFAQTDQYQVVLTKRPTGTVVVNLEVENDSTEQVTVTPTTLTFEPGNYDVPRTVVVRAVSDAVTEGVHYSRVSHSLSAGSIDNFYGVTVEDVAKGFAALLNGDTASGFVANVTTAADTATLIVERADGRGFTSEFLGAAVITPSMGGQAAEDVWTAAQIDLAEVEPIEAGDIWLIALNGTAYGYEVAGGDDISAIAAGLLGQITSGPFDATRVGSRLNITPMSDQTFPLNGPVNDGQVFSVNVKGIEFSYVAGVNGDPLTLDAVAAGLQTAIELGPYEAEFSGGTLTVRPDFTAFSVDVLGEAIQAGAATISGTNSLAHYARVEVSLSVPPSTVISADDQWTLRLNGTDFEYRVGRQGESLSIGSVDVKITDNEAADILVTQVGGDTKVTEPTSRVLMGDGQVTGNGTVVDNLTQFQADFGQAVMYETDEHDSVFTAQSLDSGSWSLNANDEIKDAESLPHITVKGTGDGNLDFYSFTVTETMLQNAGPGGVDVVLDIDHGFELSDRLWWASQLLLLGPVPQQTSVTLSGDVVTDEEWTVTIDGTAYPYTVASEADLSELAASLAGEINAGGQFHAEAVSNQLTIRIADGLELDEFAVTTEAPVGAGLAAQKLTSFNANGVVYDDGRYWSYPDNYPWHAPEGGTGSDSFWDDYLEYTIDRPGTYFVRVDNWLKYYTYLQTGRIEGIPEGVDYDLHVSIESHEVDKFQFSPDPVLENELLNNASQSIEDNANWFLFYDAEIGNQDYPNGLITSGTPYAKILGAGDGSWDIYEFEVTDSMLNPNAGSLSGIRDTVNTYYSSATIQLSGSYRSGDIWSLTLNGQTYSYEAGTAVAGFAGDLNSLDGVAAGLSAALPSSFEVVRTGTQLQISDSIGFRVDDIRQDAKTAGSATTLQQALNGVTPIAFYSSQIKLAGSPRIGDVVSAVLNGVRYPAPASAGNDLDTVGANLAAAIPAEYNAVYDPATDTLTLSRLSSYTLEVEVASVNTGTAGVAATSSVLATLSGTPEQPPVDTATTRTWEPGNLWKQAVIDFSGTTAQNQSWTLRMTNDQGVLRTRTYTPIAGATPEQVATGLAANAPAGYTLTPSGSQLTIENTSNTFSIELELSKAATNGSISTTGVASHYATAVVALSGSAHEGEVWTVNLTRLDGTTEVPQTFSVTAADQGANGVDVDDVGAQLVARIELLAPGEYSPSYDSATNRLTVSDPGGILISLDPVQQAAVQGSMQQDLPNSQRAVTRLEVDLSSTTVDAASESWQLTLDGQNYTYVAQETIDDVGAALAADGHGVGGFSAAYSAANDQLTLRHASSHNVTLSVGGSGTVATTRSVEIDLSAEADGTQAETWVLTIDGVAHTYNATASNTVNQVGSKFDTSAGSGGVAPSISNSYVVDYDTGTKLMTIHRTNQAALTASLTRAGSAITAKESVTVIDLTGSSVDALGETWSLNLNGTPVDYTTAIDIDEVGQGLEGLAGIPVAFSVAYDDSTDNLVVTKSGNADFGGTLTRDAASVGTVTRTETADTWSNVELDLTGPALEDEQWTLTLGGTTKTATIGTTQLNDLSLIDTVDEVATYFKQQFQPGGAPVYSVVKTGTTLTITRQDGTPFTISHSIDAPTVTGAMAVHGSSVPSHWTSGTTSLLGTVHADETWTLTLTPWNGAAQAIPFVARDFDADLDVDLADIAAGLADQLAGLTATNDQLTLPAGQNLAAVLSVVPAPLAAAGQISGELPAAQSSRVTLLDDDGTFSTGDRWQLTLDGQTPYEYVASDTDTLQEIAEGLQTAIGSDYVVSLLDTDADTVSETLVVYGNGGAAVVVDSIEQRRVAGTSSGTMLPTDQRPYDLNLDALDITLQMTAGNSFPFGETWSIVLNGTRYSYRVPNPDEIAETDRNLSFIAGQLANEIDEATYDGADLFDVTSTGNTISISRIKASPYDRVTPEVARGDGTVKAVFDVDHSSGIEGSRPHNVSQIVANTGYYWWDLERLYPYTYYTTVTTTEYHEFAQNAFLELWHQPLGETTWTLLDSSGGSSVVDHGSTSVAEPFLDTNLLDAGHYQIRVGSFRDYVDNSVFADEAAGVVPGISYQLNVSLQRHGTNQDAIDLVGKTVTLTSGNGIGQSAEIRKYNPETKTFSVGVWNSVSSEYEPLPITPLLGDKLEVSFDPLEEYTDYPVSEDTYTVVLTRAPGDDEVVVVDVLPQVTRTYNSTLAFDANAGFGENAAIQVMVATSRATVEMGGVPADNETWTIVLDGIPYSVSASGKSLEQIVSALQVAIDNSTAGDGTIYRASLAGASSLQITATNGSNPENFFAEFAITPDTDGSFEVSGTQGASPGNWQQALIEMTGTPAVNETWTLALGGDSYAYDVSFREDLASIARGLAALIDPAIYHVSVLGRVITVSRIDAADLSATVTIAPRSEGFAVVKPQVVFLGPVTGDPSGATWDVPQTVHVRAIDDPLVDGRDAIVFPAMEERINEIRGPLTVNGGIQVGEERFLENPFMLPAESNWPMADGFLTGFGSVTIDGVQYVTLSDANATHVDPELGEQAGFDPRLNDAPYEFILIDGDARGLTLDVRGRDELDPNTVIFNTRLEDVATLPRFNSVESLADHYFFSPVNPNFNVVEEDQVDVLNVFNGNSVSDDTGVLTENRLYGFGMGPDTVIGETPLRGGISYSMLEVVNLELGRGSDTLTIESTHAGLTNVTAGLGGDELFVNSVGGHTNVSAGGGDDRVTVVSQVAIADSRVDQMGGLLTIDGGPGADIVNVDDTGDSADNTGELTSSTLRGLGMPRVSERQRVRVQARSGSYTLGADGYGQTTLSFEMTVSQVRDALNTLFGSADNEVQVDETVEIRRGDVRARTYEITFNGLLAGSDLPQLTWTDSKTPQLTAFDDASAGVEIETVRDGTTAPGLNTVQTLRLDATSGSVDLRVAEQVLTVPFDSDAAALTALLEPVLNPNNAFLNKPHTDNFSVAEFDGTLHIMFRGEHAHAALEVVDIANLVGSLELVTRVDGINYYDVDTLNIKLGSGNDQFNVRSTHVATVTNLATGAGDDRVYVTSDAASDLSNQPVAHGTLDGIQGLLNVDAQAGANGLFVSDYESPNADVNAVLTDSTLTGLAPAALQYQATGGSFDQGIVIWAGTGDDAVTVNSVEVSGITITTLYANVGDDLISIDASDPGNLGLCPVSSCVDWKFLARSATIRSKHHGPAWASGLTGIKATIF